MNLGRRHTHGQTSQGKSKDGLSSLPDQQAAAESAGFYRDPSRSTSWEHQPDIFTHHLRRALKQETLPPSLSFLTEFKLLWLVFASARRPKTQSQTNSV